METVVDLRHERSRCVRCMTTGGKHGLCQLCQQFSAQAERHKVQVQKWPTTSERTWAGLPRSTHSYCTKGCGLSRCMFCIEG